MTVSWDTFPVHHGIGTSPQTPGQWTNWHIWKHYFVVGKCAGIPFALDSWPVATWFRLQATQFCILLACTDHLSWSHLSWCKKKEISRATKCNLLMVFRKFILDHLTLIRATKSCHTLARMGKTFWNIPGMGYLPIFLPGLRGDCCSWQACHSCLSNREIRKYPNLLSVKVRLRQKVGRR